MTDRDRRRLIILIGVGILFLINAVRWHLGIEDVILLIVIGLFFLWDAGWIKLPEINIQTKRQKKKLKEFRERMEKGSLYHKEYTEKEKKKMKKEYERRLKTYPYDIYPFPPELHEKWSKEDEKREKEEEEIRELKEGEGELDYVPVPQVEKEEKEENNKLVPEDETPRRGSEIEPYKIIHDYREIFRRSDMDQFQGGSPESMLPYSEQEIKDAIKSELLKETDNAGIEHLRNLYESLSRFIPDKEAKIMREWWDKVQLDFKEGMEDWEKILVSELDDQGYFLALDKQVQNTINKIREEARSLRSEINKFIEEKEKLPE